MKYRKRPVIVDAVQWTGTDESLQQIMAMADRGGVGVDVPHKTLIITTPEGNMIGDLGDWIIRGVEGEVYPCKDSIFRASYEGA